MKKQLLSILLVGLSLHAGNCQSLDGFFQTQTSQQLALEKDFLEAVNFESFKKHLQIITAEPHVAGSPANDRVKDYLVKTMKSAGWDTQTYLYDVYLSKEPGESSVSLVTPVRMPLNQQEYILEEDPFSAHPDLWKGWNAYSGSGEVIAEVVYANYGTKADFEKLLEMGVDLKGKIVLARYGGNFRGYKAKFAEAAGAAGLLIFTDPGDSGYARGLVYPEGVYYNESGIQRGSLLTEDFTGDPLTPFEPALPLDGKKKIKRIDPKDANLHTIPVIPLSYGSIKPIMELMTGQAVPAGWQGGLPFTYRLEGGPELKVHLKVEQKRDFVRVHNVVGTLQGSEYPDEWVILGCHFDAWAFGATDPNSGTAMLLALSETLGEMAKAGKKPKRSILIAHWDAEEHGVIGSSEWVEQLKEELQAKAVAYLNFDAGVSGKTFGASASPTLKTLITEATKEVKMPGTEQSVYEKWTGEKEAPTIGNLGGGSDHIAFYMHAGIPSLSGGSGGPTLYHTNYDSFSFYERFVDPDFTMGGAIEQVVGIMTLRLANAALIPYDLLRYATDLQNHFENAEKGVKAFDDQFGGFEKVKSALADLETESQKTHNLIHEALQNNTLSKAKINGINKQLISLEKSFLDEKGMYFGSWYQSLYAATDPFSGYASWMLPGIQYEIENKSSDRLGEWDERYATAIQNLRKKIGQLQEML
ncbi:M28 family peptidase [Pararhodonellum marinum]|uniref:M28 family peptidase n=1 Tax=Pararhodonellum marinum TaxID=2755358 RepID=UPI0018907C67|nr:M28 family peptidase [Pararhodonellum marinum]